MTQAATSTSSDGGGAPQPTCGLTVAFDVFTFEDIPGAQGLFQQVEVEDDGDILVLSDVISRRSYGSGDWEVIPLPDWDPARVLKAGEQGSLWLGGTFSIYCSLNGDDTWVPFDWPHNDPRLDAWKGYAHRLGDGIVAIGGPAEIVFISMTDIETLHVESVPELDDGLGPPFSLVHNMAWAGTKLVAAADDGRIARTEVLGPSWEALPEPADFAVELLPLPGRLLLVGRDGYTYSLHQSHDAGASWEKLATFLPFPSTTAAYAQLVVLPNGMLAAPAEGGFQVSCDDGKTFELVPFPVKTESVNDLCIDHDGALWISGTDLLLRATFPPR